MQQLADNRLTRSPPLLHKTLSCAPLAHLSFLNLFIYFQANHLVAWQTAVLQKQIFVFCFFRV